MFSKTKLKSRTIGDRYLPEIPVLFSVGIEVEVEVGVGLGKALNC